VCECVCARVRACACTLIPITSAQLCLISSDRVVFVISLPEKHKINLVIYYMGRKMVKINGSFSVNITVSSVNSAVQTFAAKCMPCVEVMSDHQYTISAYGAGDLVQRNFSA